MGIGDYVCVTLRGGAPWGFTLREGEGDTYRPFLISQIDEGGQAFLAGVREGDEVVSLNGEPCVDLTLLRAIALINRSVDCLQLLLKRSCSSPADDYESEETHCGEKDSSGEALESTTLHIFSSKDSSQSPRELIISEFHDEAYYRELDSKKPQLLCTQLHAPSPCDRRNREAVLKENDEEVQRCFSPGDMVELQVSLSEQTLDDAGCASLGSARGIEGEVSNRETTEMIHSTVTSHSVPCSVRKPLSQHGVVLSSPSMLGQLEVILQQPEASESGRGILSVGGPRVTGTVGSKRQIEEEGGQCKGVPGSFTVSFGIPSEDATPPEEQDSDSEEEQDKPNKHRARHARLRRSESLSEKQVKEAKSKCKHIALLLTAAPPNPKNKGALMFKKHRQRAKKFTLVSYGTGEDEPEYSDEEDEEADSQQGNHTFEFTLLAPNSSDKHFLTNVHSSKGVLTINWDKGLLEIERNLKNQEEMECLPETKGKGALMFAQRRQRMDEISAEHEELRRQGIPVEGVQEPEKKAVEQSYMQSITKSQAYMDVNIQQQSQQQQQYQQYQEQQYYGQQQNYQQQQQQEQQQQQQYLQQYKQHEQQPYQQQQMYQPQQEYHQEQQQVQHYSANVNGTVQHHTSEIQTSFSNRTAKPFSVENMAATPYSPPMSGTNQDSVGQGEQIASRDERISTPAIKTGLLLDARRKTTAKPMFTFKEAPKVSPNPELLNLLNRSGKKLGFESGGEEDYLSLGAEACNFLQSQRVKHKTPPPVAPKPVINPNSPPWSPQTEVTNQDMPQCAENSVSTPAVAPTTEITPAPELEPTLAPAPEPYSPPPTQEAPVISTTMEQQAWTPPEAQSQQLPQQVTAHEENGHMNSTLQPESVPVSTWAAAQTQAQQQESTNSWHPAEVQPHKPLLRKSPTQPSWVTQQPSQTHSKPSTNTWTPQIQPSWGQPQDESQSQVQSSWTPSNEQPHLQQTWGQSQEPVQQLSQASWAQPSETETQHQPAWVQQSHAQPPWVRPIPPESQQQLPWVQQPLSQAPQQSWPQAQAPGQSPPPWVSAQTQQPSINTWPLSQNHLQAQPPWIQAPQAQPQVQPQANLNPWAPVSAQAQPQPSWPQHHPEHGQHTLDSWAQEQNQAQHQPPWAKPLPPQPTPQSNWQPSMSKTLQQPPVNTWAPAQTQPQTPVNVWAPQSQQTPINLSTSMVNTRPSPKPWNPPQNAPQNRAPPPPPQRMHSFTIAQRSSPPINPMATVLNPSSPGSAFEMPAVRGKGADMFAKRQSRMEKYIVDSETVQANKASRSTSPAASLPSAWKYTPNALGRSYSLSPARVPFTGHKSASASSSPKPPAQNSTTHTAMQTSRLERGHKAPTPWEAASRHPLGLVDEAFGFQNLQQSLASNIRLAAQRKVLPEPPMDWKDRVSYQARQKTGSQTWSQTQSRSQSRVALPSFMSPTKSSVTASVGHAGYRSLPRQWHPQKYVMQASLGPSVSSPEHRRPLGEQSFKSVYTSKTWSWRR
ncbi:synaptopodin-2 isoform X2 [Channa argus]|uniref:synaptopodin-2 isoform X2 n=1 Tax=Channa argus TaxID=215402 RepID=UPI0029471CAD|nr:hypothetical protein Q8A73_012870 [Channa argus]